MFDFRKINSFQVETSTYCNVACPLCPRHHMGTSVLTPGLRQKNILAPQWNKFLNDMDNVTKENIVNMVFCGCHGDPPMTPDWEEIIINTANRNYIIDVETNGSMRTPESWARVGKVFAKTEKEQSGEAGFMEKVITFSIDGLEDTNKLYRIGINHKRVMANAKAFIDAGGRARWKMIVFEHNKHQVEEAQQLAKDMGFWEFDKHVSTRNWDYNYAEVDRKNATQLAKTTPEAITIETEVRKARKGTVDKLSETKEELNITNEGAKLFEDIVEKADLSSIRCDFKEDRMMYIDSEMNLWPCNYIAATRMEDMTHFYKLEKEYGVGWNNLAKHTIEEVFYHEYFQKIIPATWEDPSHRLCTGECRAMCGGGVWRTAWDESTNRKEL